jgi:EAL domain-containing protein (putative c-di-GMP-specific phosphodiesterase class I)
VLQVARALGITTCAEGVERVAQLEGLRRLGCTWAQGFALGEPEDADDVLRRLALG